VHKIIFFLLASLSNLALLVRWCVVALDVSRQRADHNDSDSSGQEHADDERTHDGHPMDSIRLVPVHKVKIPSIVPLNRVVFLPVNRIGEGDSEGGSVFLVLVDCWWQVDFKWCMAFKILGTSLFTSIHPIDTLDSVYFLLS